MPTSNCLWLLSHLYSRAESLWKEPRTLSQKTKILTIWPVLEEVWWSCSRAQQAISSVQFSHSVMSNSLRSHCCMPGLPVHHQLPELAQTHVYQVSDAIEPSHPLSSPSPPVLNLSQHQGLFKWVCASYQMAKVLEFQLQYQSFQWIFRTDFLQDWLVWSP